MKRWRELAQEITNQFEQKVLRGCNISFLIRVLLLKVNPSQTEFSLGSGFGPNPWFRKGWSGKCLFGLPVFWVVGTLHPNETFNQTPVILLSCNFKISTNFPFYWLLASDEGFSIFNELFYVRFDLINVFPFLPMLFHF